ncbi:MAG: hypothetical protein GY835_24035 [bacterium]|nr:hypothetical protein [bacterium]
MAGEIQRPPRTIPWQTVTGAELMALTNGSTFQLGTVNGPPTVGYTPASVEWVVFDEITVDNPFIEGDAA